MPSIRVVHRLGVLACIASLAAVSAGCGDSERDTSTTEPSGGSAASTEAEKPSAKAGSDEYAVSMKNTQFAPRSITVEAGETVTWTNDDQFDHNVVAQSGADFKSENFGNGGTYEYTPKKAGTISYVCTLHPGMTGMIVVK